MWRLTRRIAVALLAVLIALATVGATYQWFATRQDLARTPPPGRLVDIGGYRLHIWCSGEGAPAVILESGLGGSFAGWGFVQPAVARFTRVCSYDRAGLGYSDPGSTPRTTRRIARELALLLDRAGISGRVVVVGASSGGFTARVFAADYADRTAGLVLVDASHEDQRHEVPGIASFVPLLSRFGILRALDVSFGLAEASLAPSVRDYAVATRFRTAGHQAAADEIRNFEESANEVRATRRKLTIPVIVVSAGLGDDAVWRKLQQDQAELSERGCHIVAADAGHVISSDRPEVIVEAIRSVVESVRTGDSRPPCGSTRR
jgi:pimeloyl-ACP methyl ester carboxylesterase